MILTHCNAGALATAGYGTALGVIRSVYARNPRLRVMADETRPLLQGARLTAWELMQGRHPGGADHGQHGRLFHGQGLITHVVVGADRITANGDVANKIGTYTVSVLAREHGVPFYRGGSVLHRRSLAGRRRRDPHRGARSRRRSPGTATAAGRRGVSRYATRPSTSPRAQRDRHHHRAGSGASPYGESLQGVLEAT